jgi:hypothetical protein
MKSIPYYILNLDPIIDAYKDEHMFICTKKD